MAVNKALSIEELEELAEWHSEVRIDNMKGSDLYRCVQAICIRLDTMNTHLNVIRGKVAPAEDTRKKRGKKE